jgi:hypothetical protein
VEQSRDLTNRNRIGGRAGRTSGREIAKSISIKGQSCRSGGCAMKDAGLTPGDLRRVLLDTTGLRASQGAPTAVQKSAKGVVAGRSRRRPERSPTRG